MTTKHLKLRILIALALASLQPSYGQAYWTTWSGNTGTSVHGTASVSFPTSGGVYSNAFVIGRSQPGAPQTAAGEFLHVAPAAFYSGSGVSWSFLIDLTSYSVTADTIVGFSNAGGFYTVTGNPLNNPYQIEMLDASMANLSMLGVTVLGNFDESIGANYVDDDSVIDLSTGLVTSTPDGVNYEGAADGLFLSAIPTSTKYIRVTEFVSDVDQVLLPDDSNIFYLGSAVPEVSTALISLVAAMPLLLGRRRRA